MTRVSPIRTSAWTPPPEPVVRKTSWAPNARFTNSISSTAGRTARYGVTLRIPGLVVVAVVVMAALLESSAPSRALNDALGRSRRFCAICKSSVSSGSPEGRGARGSDSARSRASACRSLRDSSLIGIPHVSSQGLERAELELLHRAFRTPERLGDLANALLLDEAGQDDALLIVGQASDDIGQHGPTVDVGRGAGHVGTRRRLSPLSRQALPAVGDGISGDLEEPGGERDAAPLEAAEVGERLVEDLGRQILRLAPAAGSAGNVRVHPVEVPLIERAEALRVRLGSLDQEALVVSARGDLRRRCARRHGLIPYNGRGRAKVTLLLNFDLDLGLAGLREVELLGR